MKKNRNARKKLNDLYLYLDINSDFFYRNPPSESMKKRYEEIKEKYDEEFKYRKFREYEWNEYYGLFKLKNIFILAIRTILIIKLTILYLK